MSEESKSQKARRRSIRAKLTLLVLASVGIAVTPVLAVAYLIVAIFLFGLSRAPASSLDKTAPHEAIPEGVPAE